MGQDEDPNIGAVPMRPWRHRCAGAAALLLLVMAATARAATSDVVAALGNLSGPERFNALQSLSYGQKLTGSYTPNDVDAIVQGMEGFRRATLSVLFDKIKGQLTAAEIVQLLGPLTNADRYGGLQTLWYAQRLAGPYTPNDVDAIVQGMEGFRRATLGVLFDKIKGQLTAGEIVQLLGTLKGADRYGALQTLLYAQRLAGPYSPSDVDAIVQGMEEFRRATLGLLSYYLKGQPTTDEVAQLLGNLTGADRESALQMLNYSIRPLVPYSPAEVGMSPASKNSGSASAPASTSPWVPSTSTWTRSTNTWSSAPSPTGPAPSTKGSGSAPNLGTSATVSAPGGTSASIKLRIARLRAAVAQQFPYLYGASGPWQAVSIVARDLPARVFGFTDYQALYDQLYFSLAQYSGLANKAITQAESANNAGDAGSAERYLDRAERLINQRVSTFLASQAIWSQDLDRARSYVQTTYETSKWAAGVVATAAGVPGGSVMVDAAGLLTDFALDAQVSGLNRATQDSLTDVFVYALISKVPIQALNGRTIEGALHDSAGVLLSNTGVISDLQSSLKNAQVRNLVIEAVTSAVALPAELKTAAAIRPIVDRLINMDATGFRAVMGSQ